jgi:Zn-dependent M32 family carboxypeptidase
MKMLGFDFNGGRLDVSAHPFCGGVPEDVRITTRYDEDELLSALFGVIHETGHALRTKPAALGRTADCLARSTAIHESQSLFFEMQLGRSEAFLKHLLPACTPALAAGVQRREFYCLEPAREAGLYPRRCGRSELPGTRGAAL